MRKQALAGFFALLAGCYAALPEVRVFLVPVASEHGASVVGLPESVGFPEDAGARDSGRRDGGARLPTAL